MNTSIHAKDKISKVEILQLLRQHKAGLQSKYPISSLALFGSYARGEESEESDVDIMVDFNGPIGIEFVDLLIDIENLLHHKVDLVSQKAIKSHYRPHIEDDMIYV